MKLQHRIETSTVCRLDGVIKRHRGVIVFVFVALAGTAAIAQQRGESPTDTVVTVRSRDLNGTVTVSEQTITHRFQSGDGAPLVIETYSPSMEGGRLALSRRVRRTTTVTSDGTQTVEETEERSPAAPSEALRIVRRSLTTVRRSGSDSYVSERQVFELDVNGRFVPVLTQTERTYRN